MGYSAESFGESQDREPERLVVAQHQEPAPQNCETSKKLGGRQPDPKAEIARPAQG